jgi:hypothetical protein
VNVFVAASTQWLVGMAGPTGLSYASVEAVLRMSGVPRREWPELFDDVRIMEDAALDTMRRNRT